MKHLALVLTATAMIVVGVGCSGATTTTPTTEPVTSTQTTNTNTAIQNSNVAESTSNEQTTFTLDEVAEHSSSSDCWMAIDGKVYDATSYILQHPGGAVIMDGCGTDATALFHNKPNGDGDHSAAADAELETLYIGDLAQ